MRMDSQALKKLARAVISMEAIMEGRCEFQ